MADGAVLELPVGRAAGLHHRLATWSSPAASRAASVGDLAVNGTVNDLAMMGARPQWISAGFIIEDGFSIAELRDIVADMAEAAIKAGVHHRHRRHQGGRQGRLRRGATSTPPAWA